MHCMEEDIPKFSLDGTAITNCTAKLNVTSMQTQMKSKCDEKESCSLDIKRTNLDWLTTTPSSGDDCGDNSYMYV